jgi:hypothetical protein
MLILKRIFTSEIGRFPSAPDFQHSKAFLDRIKTLIVVVYNHKLKEHYDTKRTQDPVNDIGHLLRLSVQIQRGRAGAGSAPHQAYLRPAGLSGPYFWAGSAG